MREELTQKIIMALEEYDLDLMDLKNKLYIVLNDYEITNRETAIAIRDEDKNNMFFQKFLVSKAVSGRTPRTIEYYRKSLLFIFDRIGKTADETTTDDIRYYLALRQRKDGITKTTANNELLVLRSFYNFLLAEELIGKNPTLKIEKIKQSKVQRPALSEIEIEKIREACRTSRETAMVELLLSTGCRVTELVNIKIEDINNDELVVTGKGEKERTVYLNAKAIMSIDRYLKERKDENPYLFCGGYANSLKLYGLRKEDWYKHPEIISDTHTDKSTIEQTLRKIGKRAEVKGVHPHRFRRTCATMALRRGMPIEQVSKMLGHTSIDTTMIYLDLSEAELKQSHKKYVI